MQDLKTKVGYIRGLIDGLGLDESKKEGRVMVHIVDLLDQITDSVMELDDGYDDLVDYVEAIDEDLMELEDHYFEDEDDDVSEDDDEDDMEDFPGGFSFECPGCREVVYVDDDALEKDEDLEILCPGCGEVVLINEEWDEDEDLSEGDEDLPFEDEVIDDNEGNKE